MLKKIIAYPLTLLYYLVFLIILLIFHAIQWLCFNVFGYQAHKKSVDYLNFCLLKILYLIGVHTVFENKQKLEAGKPHIIVANHQSHYDISPIVWYLRKLHPKFISKKELGKGIPSISYNLRHGGSILIDRKNPRQALPEIKKFGQYLNKTNRAAVIFPEGTRSRNGKPKRFSPNGLKTLFKYCPDAVVVPVTINNSWKILKNGMFPLNPFVKMTVKVQPPIKISDYQDLDLLITDIEQSITKDIQL
ncbi:1-acyl-sn-glycerol-3-phosphate acyltransferase [Mesonia hippocampi]|uniref:1-acyl-sn-glycerol-3-phosphate acyltransferase n=1 Tax=Mesonia hippocampi TaxID=1628250 RepID=A0A840EJH7_9FLAO|nr:1-acyl-sn-glycerol-3-phosphate acyltransferase [Mesonia hippocampi]